MKKILFMILSTLILLCLAFAGGCTSSCASSNLPNEELQEFKLVTATKTLFIGESFTIKTTGVEESTLEFKSENSTIATVNEIGVVTAVSLGEVTVTVTSGEQSKNCYVKVIEDNRIPSLRFNNLAKENGKYVLPISSGEEYALDYDLLFDGAIVSGSVQFESTNEEIITVDGNGVVKAGNVEGNGVRAVIKVSAQYKNKYSEYLNTEITVIVSDAKWNFKLDSEEPIYPLANFVDGEQNIHFKNTVGFTVSLTISEEEIDTNLVEVTSQSEHFEVVGNLIKAKRAGVGLIKLSYKNGENVYEKLVSINVERIQIDRTDLNPTIFIRSEDVASLSCFNKFADGDDTENVFVVCDDYKTEIGIENGKYTGVDNGINVIEIQNSIFSVTLQMHFVDYYIGAVQGELWQYILEKDQYGDPKDQTLVLPKGFTEERLQSFIIYREGGLDMVGGIKQALGISNYDAKTKTLSLKKSIRDPYWFWYTGDLKYVIITDNAYYMGDVKVNKLAREPEVNLKGREEVKGDLYNGEVAYLQRQTTDETITFKLPSSFGSVKNFKIGGIVDAVFDESLRTITINTEDIKYLNAGVKVATFENQYGKKYCHLTIADYLVTQDSIENLIHTSYNNYIVVAEDVDATDVPIWPVWINNDHEFTGTVDGKGNVVSNLTLSTNSWQGFIAHIFAGTIKNIAFVNFDNNIWGGANGLIASRANGAKLENVYISGNSRSCNFLFKDIYENNVKLENVILNFTSNDKTVGVVAVDMSKISTTNVITANATDNFYEENLTLKFGDFEMVEKGLLFNGKRLIKAPAKIVEGTLYNGEAAYLSKHSDDEKQTIALPRDFGAISEFMISDTMVAFEFNKENNVVTIETATLENIPSGETTCSFLAEDGFDYALKITLADYVVTQNSLEYLAQTCFSNYIVVAEDVDASSTTITPVWINETSAFRGTLDGKGHTISNLTLSTNSWNGLVSHIFAGTIKNVAFINFDNNTWGGANGMIAARVDGARIENVYISGNARSCNTLFNTIGEDGVTLENVILNFTSSSDEVGIIANDMESVSTINVLTANDKDKFFNENADLNFGDFEIVEKGLTFNGKLMYSAPAKPLEGELYNGEIGYLETTDTSGSQPLYLPKAFDTVTDLKVDDQWGLETTWDKETKILTVTSSLEGYGTGEKFCTLVADGVAYQVKLTIAHFVIRSDAEITKLRNTDTSHHIVFATDVDASASGVYPSSWKDTYTGVIDGKGHVVSNLAITWGTPESCWHGLIYYNFKGTIKNIAFVNMNNINGGSNGLLSADVSGATLENVYVSGNAKACNTLFRSVDSNGLNVNNVILNFTDNNGNVGVITNDMTYVTTNNVLTANDKDKFFKENETLNFGDFEIVEKGLTFNGKLLYSAPAKPLEGELYNGEVGYLEKTAEAGTQTLKLPKAFDTVTDLKVDGLYGLETTWDKETQTLTVTDAISNFGTGEKICTLVADEIAYQVKLTIADYVIRSSADTYKLMYTGHIDSSIGSPSDYIVVAADIDASEYGGITPATWRDWWNGTLDGKGHVIKNLSLSNAWWGFVYRYFCGTIKNVAFVNFSNTGGAGRGLISENGDGGKLENVYISGNSKALNSLFQTVTADGVTLNNVILNFTDSSGNVGVIAPDMTNVNTTNVITANDGSDFFGNNQNLAMGDFKMTEEGLTFNGKVIYAKL